MLDIYLLCIHYFTTVCSCAKVTTFSTFPLSLQKLFLDNLRKALTGHGGSKQLTESAAIACVKLCKASTYINWEDNSVIFLLVQSIVVDLKVCEHKPCDLHKCQKVDAPE